MQPSFTIVAEGETAGADDFVHELSAAAGGEVEREDSGLSLLATAAIVFGFVVSHKEAIQAGLDLAQTVAKIVSGLIGLAERHKVKLTLVEAGRQITIEADRRADLEQMMTAILKAPPVGAG
jgi:hypothetical protein